MKKKQIITLGLSATITFILMASTGCGGGSSSDGILIEGTLTEAGGASHRMLRHSEGQRIENVEICAVGQCSTTDGQGQWGFVAPENFNGGTILFSANGHGINTTSSVDIPQGANEVFIDFQHVQGGKVQAHHITVDGQTDHKEPHAHE